MAAIACAAQAAVDHRKPLMVIPGGTLNHLARDVGLDDPIEAIEAVKKGQAIALDVGTIDGEDLPQRRELRRVRQSRRRPREVRVDDRENGPLSLSRWCACSGAADP